MNNDVRSIMVYYAVQLLCPVAGLIGGLHVKICIALLLNITICMLQCNMQIMILNSINKGDKTHVMCFIPNY